MESLLHTCGWHWYSARFSSSSVSDADGMGFVFTPCFPCPKDIQHTVSIFLNKHGVVSTRVFDSVSKTRAGSWVKFETGDWVDLEVDLDKQVVVFGMRRHGVCLSS